MEKDNIEENRNIEISELISDEENYENEETVKGNSFAKVILANILDQLLIVAGSAVLLLLFDMILRIFGYMFVRDTGALLSAVGIIYFILNCFYAPLLEKSKLKNTIAKKILNMK